MPAVSVILPVHNGMPFLPETLDSLAAQTFKDFEVILQDDGSTDASLECMKSYTHRDERFVLEAGPASGVVAAANRAHERAAAPLHVRMDADDLATPDRLAKQHAFAADHPDVGYFGSLIEFFPRDEMGEGLQDYEAWNNGCVTHDAIYLDRFVELPIGNPSLVMRGDVYRDMGRYIDGPYPEDYDLFLRCAARGIRFGKVPEVLVQWRDHPDRATHQDGRYSLDAFFELKARHLVPELEAAGRPVAVVGAGPAGKRWAQRLMESGVRVSHFVEVHPGRIGQTIHGAEVVGYDDLDRLSGCFLLAAVGRKSARDDVKQRLAAAGFEEGVAFLCVQ